MAEILGREFDPIPLYDTVPDVMLTNTGDVVEAMRQHPDALRRSGLEHLVPFCEVYLGVTDRAHKKLELGLPPDAGGFVRPDIVATAIPHFGQQWFNHVLNFADGNYDDIPDVWMVAFSSPAMRRAVPAIQFAIPMGGHIDRDLGYTVDKVNAPRDYYPDYTDHIGLILKATAEAHAEDLLPMNAFARNALTSGVLQLIAWKRAVAWQLGQQIMDARGDEAARARVDRRIERYSLLSGKAMLSAGNAALSQIVRFAPAARPLNQTVRL